MTSIFEGQPPKTRPFTFFQAKQPGPHLGSRYSTYSSIYGCLNPNLQNRPLYGRDCSKPHSASLFFLRLPVAGVVFFWGGGYRYRW